MDRDAIAKDLMAGIREGRAEENLDRLYAPDAVSVVAGGPPGVDRTTTGLEGIHGKHAWWRDNAEVHSASAEGPFPNADDAFAVIFDMDVTIGGKRNKMREVAVYHTSGGKIVREEFFYDH